uniref:uncharacterized protein n=1 Tax=Myxine glutinosa TaxID=7769 RepID=UPI00358EC042
MPATLQLQRVGKRGGRRSLTAMSVGRSGSLLFISDTDSGRHFLCDTGAQVSVLPVSAADRVTGGHGPALKAANGSAIQTFGKRTVALCFGGQRFTRNFVTAKNTLLLTPVIVSAIFKWFFFILLVVAPSEPPKQVPPKKGSKKSIYMYKVLKQVHLDADVSSKAMSIMNSFVNDIFERITAEASHLLHHHLHYPPSINKSSTTINTIHQQELHHHHHHPSTSAPPSINKHSTIISTIHQQELHHYLHHPPRINKSSTTISTIHHASTRAPPPCINKSSTIHQQELHHHLHHPSASAPTPSPPSINKSSTIISTIHQQALHHHLHHPSTRAPPPSPPSINNSTITLRDIQTAVRLLLPGELSKHTMSEGTKAVTKYTRSK